MEGLVWRKIAHDLLRFTLLARPRHELRYRGQPQLSQTETIPELIVSRSHIHICLFQEKALSDEVFFSLQLWRKGVSDIVIERLPRRDDFWAWIVNSPCFTVHLKALIYVYVCKGSAEKIFAQKHLVFFIFPQICLIGCRFLLFVFEITSWTAEPSVSCQRLFSLWHFKRE